MATSLPSPPAHDIISEIMHSRGRWRSLLNNIWTHDLAERFRMRRKSDAMRAQLGDDYDVGTYPSPPGSQTMIVNNGGWLKGVVMALALAGGGAGVGSAMGLFDKAQSPPVVPTISAPSTALWEGYYVDVEVAPDGTVTTKLVDRDGKLIRELK